MVGQAETVQFPFQNRNPLGGLGQQGFDQVGPRLAKLVERERFEPAGLIGGGPLPQLVVAGRLEQSGRCRRIGHQVDALHLGDLLDDDRFATPPESCEDIVRKTDVLRSVFGVPEQLLGQRVPGVEMKIAEQPLARPGGDVADHADPVPVIPRPGRTALGVVHVDLGALVERRRPLDRLGQIGPPVLRCDTENLHAADDSAPAVDRHDQPA